MLITDKRYVFYNLCATVTYLLILKTLLWQHYDGLYPKTAIEKPLNIAAKW